MRKRTLPVRATPPSERFPDGVPAETLDGYYGAAGDRLLLDLGLAARRAESEEEAATLRHEMLVLHEIHAFFPPGEDGEPGVTVLTDAQAQEKRREWGEGVEEPLTGHGSFRIPAKARPQTALFGDTEPPVPSEMPGRFSGAGATATERASGAAVEEDDLGPLKPGSAAHSVLRVYGDGQRRTAYEASLLACGDFHARRRESTRLLTRGFLVKRDTAPNPAPGGREHVDAYVVTLVGQQELERLNGLEAL